MTLHLLNELETRILGSLIEKEQVTPENYPLSLNALANACNQTTNRDPVTSYSQAEIESGIESLREKKLAVLVHLAGSRVSKYRHSFTAQYTLSPAGLAILCVLFLRGPQTPGELRIRTERLHQFASLGQVEETLNGLAAGELPLVQAVPQRPGQKEVRYAQLFSPFREPVGAAPVAAPRIAASEPPADSAAAQLEERVGALERQMAELQEEVRQFKRQFE